MSDTPVCVNTTDVPDNVETSGFSIPCVLLGCKLLQLAAVENKGGKITSISSVFTKPLVKLFAVLGYKF